MPGGVGALLLRPDALPDANPPLFQAWDRLSGVLDFYGKQVVGSHQSQSILRKKKGQMC